MCAGVNEQRLRAKYLGIRKQVGMIPVSISHPVGPPESPAHVDRDQSRHRLDTGILCGECDLREPLDHFRRDTHRPGEKITSEREESDYVETDARNLRHVLAHFAKVEL